MIQIQLLPFQYDERQLNLQLRFLKQLFSLDTYKQSLSRNKSEQIDAYLKTLSAEVHRSIMKSLHELQTHIDRIVQKSGYAEVCISTLFSHFCFTR